MQVIGRFQYIRRTIVRRGVATGGGRGGRGGAMEKRTTSRLGRSAAIRIDSCSTGEWRRRCVSLSLLVGAQAVDRMAHTINVPSLLYTSLGLAPLLSRRWYQAFLAHFSRDASAAHGRNINLASCELQSLCCTMLASLPLVSLVDAVTSTPTLDSTAHKKPRVPRSVMLFSRPESPIHNDRTVPSSSPSSSVT